MAKNKEKKLFAFVLSASLALSAVPSTVFADETDFSGSSYETKDDYETKDENKQEFSQDAEIFEKEEKNETKEPVEEEEPKEETVKETVKEEEPKEETVKEPQENEEENKNQEENTENIEKDEENIKETDKLQEILPTEAKEKFPLEQVAVFTKAVPVNDVTLTAVVGDVSISMTSPAFKEGYKLYVYENPKLAMYGDSYKNKITSKKENSVLIKNYSFIITENIDGTEKAVLFDEYWDKDSLPLVTISGLSGVKEDSDIGLYFSSDASHFGDTFEITDFDLSDGAVSFKMNEFKASKNESSVNSGLGTYLAITQVKKMSKCNYDETAQSRWTVAPVSLASTTDGITYTVENHVD